MQRLQSSDSMNHLQLLFCAALLVVGCEAESTPRRVVTFTVEPDGSCTFENQKLPCNNGGKVASEKYGAKSIEVRVYVHPGAYYPGVSDLLSSIQEAKIVGVRVETLPANTSAPALKASDSR